MFEIIINDISRQIRTKIEMANDKTGVLTQFTKDEVRKDIEEYEHAIAVLKKEESAPKAPNTGSLKLPPLDDLYKVVFVDRKVSPSDGRKCIAVIYDDIVKRQLRAGA